MTDQTQRLEIATVKAEVGSNILSRFSNDAINADGIPTDSGAIPNLKQVIKSIEDKASVSTSIYPTVAAGLAATAEGGMFLVASADTDEIYEVWRKVSGAAVDTGKRALSSQAAEDAVTAAQASAEAAAAAAGNAAEQFQDIFEADQIEREAEFRALMDASGYESVYLVYGPGVVVNRQTQLVQKDGELYRVTNAADLPLTLTGTWSTDAPKLMAVGDAALRQSIESAEGYDQIGATLPTGVVSTVKGFFSWILDRITLSTSGSAGLVAAIAKGGRVVIKNGGHYLLPADGGAICDYGAEPVVGFAGNTSKRIDLSGETPGGSIISNQTNDFAVTLQGSYLPDPPHVTQNFGGFDRVGNFTIVGPSVTTPVTTDVGGSGLRIAIKANTEIYSFTAINLRRGMVLEDVLTSTLQDVNIIGCYRGITAQANNNISAPNAMSWRRVRVHACAEHGVVSDLGSASHLDVLTSEGNGTMGTGSNSVWFTAQAQQTAGMTVITAWYSELNSGSTDFRFDNNSTHQQVIKFNGGMFQRATSTAYVGTCIYATSAAGRAIINLDSVSFRSDFGYVPSSSRPYWDVGPYSEVIWNETCVFSEVTSLVYWLCLYRPYSFTIAADGTILSGPPGFGITALGSGLYRIYRTTGRADFAKFADDVSVEITPGVGGFTGYCPAKTTATIDIQLHNGAAPANAKFDLTIRRNTGFYA